MIATEMQRLADNDPGLPGLALVLDVQKVQEVLAQSGYVEGIQHVELDYIRYKPGIRAISVMQVKDAGGKIHPLVLTAHDSMGWKKFTEYQLEDPPGFPTVAISEQRCSLEWFPRDKQLKQIAKLYDPYKSHKIYERLLGELNKESGKWGLEALTYKPHRRFVAKATSENRAMTLKCYTRIEFEAIRQRMHRIQPRLFDDIVPSTIACSDRYSMIAMEWLDGETMSRRMLGEQHSSWLFEHAGQLLGQWHLLAQQSLQEIDWRHTGVSVHAMQKIIEDVGRLLPEMRHPLSILLGRVYEMLVAMQSANDVIHGDFYAKQIIVQNERMRLIDFDEVGRGHRYQDLGNFVGHMIWDAIRASPTGQAALDPLETNIHAFLSGYERCTSALRWPEVCASIVAGTLRCLPHAFRRGLEDWPRRMYHMLEFAQRWIVPHNGTLNTPASVPCIHSIDRMRVDECAAYLDLASVETQLKQRRKFNSADMEWSVQGARLVRHKPGRRLLVEYVLKEHRSSSELCILGKARFQKRVDVRILRLHSELQFLRSRAVHIPVVVDELPQSNMWLQEKLDGEPLLSLNDVRIHRIVGAGLAEIHASGLKIDRIHSAVDELQILRTQYDQFLLQNPRLFDTAHSILELAALASQGLEPTQDVLLHRDFYFDQVLALKNGIAFLDFDLAAMGPAELDIGNYIAHLDDWAIRFERDADYCSTCIKEFLAGYKSRQPLCDTNVEIWRLLSLARLAAISQRIPNRNNATPAILSACKQKLEFLCLGSTMMSGEKFPIRF